MNLFTIIQTPTIYFPIGQSHHPVPRGHRLICKA